MKHISYPKIQQFRNVVSSINRELTFVGLDDDNNPIYDPSIKKPVLTFSGTVKLHGTNASVCFNSDNGLWFQSRNGIITPEKDNNGFAFFAQSNHIAFVKLINTIQKKYNIDTDIYTITIYGEWAGKGIQKGVGISNIDKAFFIFGVKISKLNDVEFNSYWLNPRELRDNEFRIFNIYDFKTFSIDIDFNNPRLIQNKLIEITNEVEKQCPVSKTLGVDGIGEGVVWSVQYKDVVYRFKVKGEKHSVTKVKKLAEVDVEKMNNIQEFVEYCVTENRFNQAIENIFHGNELDVKKLGELLRWFINDVTSEEIDTMKENNLEPKDVNKFISNKVREMFFENLKL